MSVRYSIDTSALLDAWVRWYPPEVFVSLWEKLDGLVNDGVVVASDEVKNELQRKADDVHDWVSARTHMLVPIDDGIQHRVLLIMQKFPKFADERTGKSMADPFVIALAQDRGLTVITGEKGGSAARPRIPFVCAQYGVPCIDFTQLIRQCGWKF